MKRTKGIIMILMIMNLTVVLRGMIKRNINPDSFLIGSSALDGSENNYSINPASIGLLKDPAFFQDFALSKSSEGLLYSQNIAFKLMDRHSILIGYSMKEDAVSLKNSLFRLNYALSLWDVIFLGVNGTYSDKNYIKYRKEGLTADLGALLSLRIDDIIKFINIGAYGLDANMDKLSLRFPSTNYGQKVAWGVAIGFKFADNMEAVLSLDKDIIDENRVVNERMNKYGVQVKLADFIYPLYLRGTKEYAGSHCTGTSMGVSMDMDFIKITYGQEKETGGVENQYLSFSFKLSKLAKPAKQSGDKEGKGENEKKEKKEGIKMYYYKDQKEYRILFQGNRQEVVFWCLVIRDGEGNVVKEFNSKDQLPEYIVWDGRGKEKNLEEGVYTARLVWLENPESITHYQTDKEIIVTAGDVSSEDLITER
ncbi:MAG: hypothetical protein JW827_12695 [Spirochaetes bacterium]|nr:hypothetical protein [Spirochaetota bacterium]